MFSIKNRIGRFLPYSIKSLLLTIFGYFNFKRCVLLNKPYFGHYLSAGQTWSERRDIMRKLLEKEISKSKSKDYKILEIGSWGGQSAILWGSICRRFSKGKIFCIDTWAASTNSPNIMKRAVRRDKIMKLFLHNVMSCGLKEYIFPIRGSSDELANILKPQTFDFIYIDGDHAYSQFKKDLINYSKFCKNNGVLCGDDLDVFPDEIDLENAERHKEEDFIKDPKSNKSFHPGIVLAIKEFFGDVNMLNGFWFIRKSKNSWKRIII